MSKSSEFSPYKGEVVWSSDDQRWVIAVLHHHGGMVKVEEFFQGVVLANHLKHAGVASVFASLDTKRYTCVVWRQQPGDLAKQGKKLLEVLKTHYSQFKGLAVEWTMPRTPSYYSG